MHVRKSKGGKTLSGAAVRAELDRRVLPDDYPPDLVVAGDDVVGLPFVTSDIEKLDIYRSPFTVTDSKIRLHERCGLAFAIGLCSLMYALGTIRLGIMPWPEIIADAIGVEMGA